MINYLKSCSKFLNYKLKKLKIKKIVLIILFVSAFSCEEKLDYDSEKEIIDRIETKNSNPKIYLDDNQITVKCPEANLHEKGKVNGLDYTVVSEEKLRQMLAKGEAVSCVCTSQVKNMSSLFKDNKLFNQDLSSWDTSNVTNMRRTFFNARSFNKEIGDWDTSKVTDMRGMFTYAYSFDQDIGDWDTSNVTLMSSMFEYAELFNQDLSRWCVTNIKFKAEYFSVSSALSDNHHPIWGTCPK